ncbi:hypothetical protein GCM10022631_10930 [Deinococcus rubellus]|uniref:hypothetical protein n=1 Tax=Deinococcus rubellus TaxID=1889240 RepID=UPI0031EAECCF
MAELSPRSLDRSAVLAALYNGASPGGAESLGWLERQQDFDYLQGRCLKVDLSSETLDPWLYDRQYGEGAAGRVLAHLTAELRVGVDDPHGPDPPTSRG